MIGIPILLLKNGRSHKKRSERRPGSRLRYCDFGTSDRRGAAFLCWKVHGVYSTTNEVTGWTSQAVARQLEGLCLRL